MISVVTGTRNRKSHLLNLLDQLPSTFGDIPFEVIICDGGSTDGTLDILRGRPDIVLIEQGKPLGAVKAFNACFWAARGEFVCNLNDDVLLRGNIFKESLRLFEDPTIGQVAIPYKDPENKEPRFDHITLGRNTPNCLQTIYANFGITRKRLGDHAGWWGENLFHHYAGDSHLSASVLSLGYKIAKLETGYIEHFRTDDETRIKENNDSPIFYTYWDKHWTGIPAEPLI